MYYFCISFIILPNTSKVPLFGVETSIFLARLKPVAGVLVVEFVPERGVALFVGGMLVGVADDVTTQAEEGGGFDVVEESFEGVAMLLGKFLFLSWLDSVDVVVDVPDEDDDDVVPFRICLIFSVEWSFDKLPFLLEPGTNLKL